MLIIAATAIDYSLFLLKRWQEETLKSDNFYQCVENTFHHAGRIIFTSGGLLALCFVSLCFFPVDIVISFGVAPFISIAMTLSVHLTFVPAILSIFPQFFAKRGFINCIDKCRIWSEEKEKNFTNNAVKRILKKHLRKENFRKPLVKIKRFLRRIK